MKKPFTLAALITAFTALVICTLQAHAQPYDTTFGTGGTTQTAMSVGAVDDIPHAVHVLPDGKIVVGGSCGKQFCVARYLSNGTLDASFGPAATPGKSLFNRLGDDRAFATAVQPDGKIVMAGDCRVVNGLTIGFCVVRLTANGLPDATFGDNGWVDALNMSPGYDGARAIVVLPDGGIVVSGHCAELPSLLNSFCHVKLLANGTLDLSFNTTGKAITPYSGFGSNHKYVTASALRSDGMIYVVGYGETGGDDRMLILRLTPAGTAGAWQTLDFEPGHDRAFGVAIQTSGRVLVSGECNMRACLARFEADDSGLDPAFGSSGKRLVADSSVSEGNAGSIALLPDGSSMYAGWGNPTGGICYGIAARTGSSGARQTAYIVNNCQPLRGVALQIDHKPVAVGRCYGASTQWDFCVYRFPAPPVEFSNCSLDIDGDGKVLATTDTLMATRVALGFTGNAVINGVSFEPYALRKTWPEIRGWLRDHCAMPLP